MVQDHVSIHIESMLCSMPPTSPDHSIFRVRHQLREVNEKAYDPEILAIGPYHYGNDKFKFMERRKEESVDGYMPTLRELERQARNCYAETIDLSQEKFLAMMLIDGCFIVELFRKYNMKIPTDKDDPVLHICGIPNSIRRKREHLLHLYHEWCTSGLPETPELNCIPVMPSAIELRESGVRFKAVQGGQLSDIKFKNGTLELPVLYVEDNTESKFRNLIAYEQHRQSSDINCFTDYATFMDCLINSSKDVEVLRRAGIFKNYLGNDEVVAQMFNKIGDHVAISDSYYSEIFQNVNAHCNKRMNVWMAKLRRKYFHSPWASLSVLAAIVLLLLTAAQTIFTILSYTK
ncbi:hypothetical protein EUGRSUZ_H02793 [Eucalyptus grandis]|uniref:Uncharacterized protein n=2 Tax=Eucalyptus grandis TaxID=71139 RepID=A0A059B225_EUCGR|nr:hypothetical protein EUGRSUZ_H02793 [Eucalyptus grandis]